MLADLISESAVGAAAARLLPALHVELVLLAHAGTDLLARCRGRTLLAARGRSTLLLAHAAGLIRIAETTDAVLVLLLLAGEVGFARDASGLRGSADVRLLLLAQATLAPLLLARSALRLLGLAHIVLRLLRLAVLLLIATLFHELSPWLRLLAAGERCGGGILRQPRRERFRSGCRGHLRLR
jgi:hypothetical protein